MELAPIAVLMPDGTVKKNAIAVIKDGELTFHVPETLH